MKIANDNSKNYINEKLKTCIGLMEWIEVKKFHRGVSGDSFDVWHKKHLQCTIFVELSK